MTAIDQVRQDGGASPVGAVLRHRREELGWNLPDVAAWLRIRLPYLEALEAGRHRDLPGSAYALGFLRTYAGALGLDAEDMIRRFRAQARELDHKPELSFPAPVPERGVPAGAIVLLGVLLVAGAYIGWYELTGHQKVLPQTVPPVPSSLTPYAERGSAATSPQVATVMPPSGQGPSPLPADRAPAAPVTGGAPVSNPQSGRGTAAQEQAAETPASPAPADHQTVAPGNGETAPAATTPAAEGSTPSVATKSASTETGSGEAAPAGIVVKAVARSWVQVRSAGKVIYDHVLSPGESWSVPADAADATLTTGNAGGVTVSAGVVTTPPLGRVGSVRRNLPLTAAAVRDGSLVEGAPAPATAEAAAPAPKERHGSGDGATPGDETGDVSKSGTGASGSPSPAAASPGTTPGGGSPAGDTGQARGDSAATVAPATHHRTAVVKPAAAPHEMTADELNARQLKQNQPGGH
ncbi:RodZ domain-containing protein [Rhizosaccharibacter radicis]|uniref:DUF4115 domain-containing protein n=1 Tax=Rhizosaccharibacter radicis TaxID=2782605 RepID=A0ABT1VY78_9PROT|nr:DUF4115 domain-containing protein [Acetobacteraceae bacterium KSS12]